jgi:hypothetical protein
MVPPVLLQRWPLPLNAEPRERVSVKTLALRLPKHAWHTITWREGSAEKLTFYRLTGSSGP